jgi:hypothetical protein
MNLTEFKFKQGNHFSRPLINPLLHPSTNKISAYVMFTEKSIYTCADQMDWNKLIGISWGFPFNKNAIMWAYRWNTEINSFQLSPYVNYQENGINKMFFLDGNVEPFKAELNVKYRVEIYKWLSLEFKDDITFSIFKNDYTPPIWINTVNLPVNTNSILVTRRRPYHGGNTTPNNDYSVYMGYM